MQSTMMIHSKQKFKELVCVNCQLCDSEGRKADWCWPKFIENRLPFLTQFVHKVVFARGNGEYKPYIFRGAGKFKDMFCNPDGGICVNSQSCQGALDNCYNTFYAQLLGISPNIGFNPSGYYYGYENVEEMEFWLNYGGGPSPAVIDAEYTEIKEDNKPFIFTSTGKRFLNRVEKILEDRNKSKYRTRKSSTKTGTGTKSEANTSKPSISRGKKERQGNLGDSKGDKVS